MKIVDFTKLNDEKEYGFEIGLLSDIFRFGIVSRRIDVGNLVCFMCGLTPILILTFMISINWRFLHLRR